MSSLLHVSVFYCNPFTHSSLSRLYSRLAPTSVCTSLSAGHTRLSSFSLENIRRIRHHRPPSPLSIFACLLSHATQQTRAILTFSSDTLSGNIGSRFHCSPLSHYRLLLFAYFFYSNAPEIHQWRILLLLPLLLHLLSLSSIVPVFYVHTSLASLSSRAHPFCHQ